MSHALRVHLISLGCAKNLVDSEIMSGVLKANGWLSVEDPAIAEVIIINTCGFIQAAKEETIDYILDMARYKDSGNCRLLVAVGCMVQKYREEMLESLPEIDAAFGTGEYQAIVSLIAERMASPLREIVLPEDLYLLRNLSGTDYSAYLKIAEGCDNCCSYCLIPQMRGHLKSRTIEDILVEADLLIEKGVKEVIVIAQDITSYGRDIYGKNSLPLLLSALAQKPFFWIRLLYAYPARIDDELLKVMAAHQNICHYLDLPIQHIDDQLLKAMNRQDTEDIIKKKIALIYRYLPDAALRTTVMVGFPGESEEKWRHMLGFLEQGYFDWVGAFAYSREDDTLAATLPMQVDESTKLDRLVQTMAALADMCHKKQARYIGQVLDVLIEETKTGSSGQYEGRSMYQAPEVDGRIYFTADEPLKSGDIVKVKILSADIYDLVGEKI